MVDIQAGDKVLRDVDLMIFDRDGTMIDIYHYWAQMIAKRAELICQHYQLPKEHFEQLQFVMGIDKKNNRLRPEGPVGIKKREIVMQAAVDYLDKLNLADTHNTCLKLFAKVDEWSKSGLAELIKPLPNLYGLFAALKQHSCKIAIATTDRTDRAKLSLEYLKLNDQVDYVIGADGVKQSKPAPDMINLIVQELKIDKTKTVMVGDAETDITMGKNAGVKASLAVCSGITSKEQLARLTPVVLRDIADIVVLEKQPV